MAPPPNEEIIKKRLGSVNSTQESVQTCSKWVLHHRESIDKVANCWMEIYKTANDKLRTALIYVLNDVVQKAAAKRDVNVTLTFHPHLINATTISELSVKKAISRVVEVFEQRNVYPAHIIEEMKSAMVSRIATEKDESIQNTGEIDFPNLIREIERFYKNELLTEKAREIISRNSFNFKESVQTRIKDRNEGVKALADMDASRQKLVTFLDSVEKHQQRGLKLMKMIKQAQAAFNLQLRDVTVVNDAYEKFAQGIRETKQQLEAMDCSAMMLASESPPRDAPSPTAGDDPFLHGVEGEDLPGSGEDMEMDDEDKPGPSTCFLKPPKEYAASMPMQHSHSTSELDTRYQRMGIIPTYSGSQIGNQQNLMPQTHNGMASSNTVRHDMRSAVMDPRQMRFFPPPQQQQTIVPAPINNVVLPPGMSPPPQSEAIGKCGNNENQIDITQPSPNLFNIPLPSNPRENNRNIQSSSLLLYDPTNPLAESQTQTNNQPPPSLFSQQLSSPSDFLIPPPGLVRPAPLFSQQQQQPFMTQGLGGSGGSIYQKRRNSSGTEADFKPKQGRNNGDRNWQQQPYRDSNKWRRGGFAGGETSRSGRRHY